MSHLQIGRKRAGGGGGYSESPLVFSTVETGAIVDLSLNGAVSFQKGLELITSSCFSRVVISTPLLRTLPTSRSSEALPA